MVVHPLHSDIPKPERFTYPFAYVPHPLCQLAAKEVQQEIARINPQESKMFGVLVVEPTPNLKPTTSLEPTPNPSRAGGELRMTVDLLPTTALTTSTASSWGAFGSGTTILTTRCGA